MATQIQMTDLTNTTNVVNGVSNGTGIFDQLMNTVNLYLNDQWENGRLKGAEYANVLLGSIQSVISQSIQFTLQQKVTGLQVDNALKDLEVKNQQIANMVSDTGFKDRQVTEQELTGAKQRLGLDEDLVLKKEQQKLAYVERVMKDKQTAMLGLDDVMRSTNVSPDTIYTPRYLE